MGIILKSHLKQHLTGWPARLLNHMLPPRCLSCGAGVQDTGRLCAGCWKGLKFLQGPSCACCGHPFDFISEAEGSLCGRCLTKKPSFDLARSALRYDDGSRPMILSFKHGDRTDYADFLAQLLTQVCPPLKPSGAIVIPVPLHKRRLRRRRYNQAMLIGQSFAGKKSLDYIPDMIIRIKHTPPQQGNYGHRKRNLAGAFEFRDSYRDRVRGRTVILVDDVYTTGATAGACARILKAAGAGRVEVLTLARVC